MRPVPRASALLLCLGVAACDVKVGDKGMSVGVATEVATDDWKRSYTLPPGGRLEVTAINGPIDVTGTDGAQAEVRIERQAKGMTREAAQQALALTSIHEDAGPERVSIELRAGDGRMRRSAVTIRTSVRVPRGLATVVKVQNGAIRLESVDAGITAAATNGAITGHGISGALVASVINGRMSVDLSSVTGDVQLTAMNGGLGLGIPPDLKADIDASALNGGVTIDPQLKLSSAPSDVEGRGSAGPFSSRISGRLNGGGPKISAQVTNGAVRIGLPGSRGLRESER